MCWISVFRQYFMPHARHGLNSLARLPSIRNMRARWRGPIYLWVGNDASIVGQSTHGTQRERATFDKFDRPKSRNSRQRRGHFISRSRYNINETQILQRRALSAYRFISPRVCFCWVSLSCEHLPIPRSKIKIDEAIKETEIKHRASWTTRPNATYCLLKHGRWKQTKRPLSMCKIHTQSSKGL